MGRRFLLFAFLIISFGSVQAQMTREAAEDYLRMSNRAPSGANREMVIWSLTAPDREIIEALDKPTGVKALAAVNEVTRRRSSLLLRAISTALPKADGKVGLGILFTFEKVGGSLAKREIEKAVGHAVPEVRWRAAVLAAEWGFKGGRPALIEAVNHGEHLGVPALGKVGSKSDLPVLRRYYDRVSKLPDPSHGPSYAHAAIFALARLGDRVSVSKLRKEVDHPSDRQFRLGAVQTLGTIRSRNDVQRLITTLKDPVPGIQVAAIEALGLAGDVRAVSPLSKWADRESTNGSSAPRNLAKARGYARYVADCLKAETKPMPLRSWNQKNRL